MKNSFFIFVFLLVTASAFSQSITLTGKKLANYKDVSFIEHFTKYQVFQIEFDVERNGVKKAFTDNQYVSCNLNLEDGPSTQAFVVPTKVLSEKFTITENNITKSVQPQIYTFGGTPDRNNGRKLALTFAQDFISGFFENEGGRYYIEPAHHFKADAEKNLYIVYHEDDVRVDQAFCASHDVNKYVEEHQEESKFLTDACPKIAELAIADDCCMLSRYGNITGVTNHNTAVINSVNLLFDNEFNNPIVFQIVTIWTPPSCPQEPWTSSTDAYALYNSFVSWAQGGGFGIQHDFGELWTCRPLECSVAGIAGVGGVCSSPKYHVLSDFTNNLCLLTTMTAHEIGHNFGCLHASVGIMLPVVTCTSTWDAASITTINNALTNAECLDDGACTPTIPNVPPIDLDIICTFSGDTYCYDFHHFACLAGFEIYEEDPKLIVTVTGTKICFESIWRKQRITPVYVTPLDICGDPGPTVVWNIIIDYPLYCSEMVGPNNDDNAGYNVNINENNTLVVLPKGGELEAIKSIKVFDVNGRLQYESDGMEAEINLMDKNLPSGVLFVQIFTEQGFYTEKMAWIRRE